MSITSKIGIMQGRLSPKIDGKIQAFPAENWEREFHFANEIGFSSIEWIVEKPLNSNPLFYDEGLDKIKHIVLQTNVSVDYVCADIFMEEPINNEEKSLVNSKTLINKLISNSQKIGIKYIEIPFVDNSSLKDKDYHYLINFLNSFERELENNDVYLNLETDLPPKIFLDLLNELNPRIGANYDIGNSASLGYDYLEEIKCYGERVNNIHIKDRILGGPTVEFGSGNANIANVLKLFDEINYDKGIIIQGARGLNDILTATNQFNFTLEIINKINYA